MIIVGIFVTSLWRLRATAGLDYAHLLCLKICPDGNNVFHCGPLLLYTRDNNNERQLVSRQQSKTDPPLSTIFSHIILQFLPLYTEEGDLAISEQILREFQDLGQIESLIIIVVNSILSLFRQWEVFHEIILSSRKLE